MTRLAGRTSAPDLVFPRLRKVIFVNGCFWHMHTCGRCRIPAARRAYWVAKLERNAARDRRVQRALRREGWGVLVVWECQTTATGSGRLRARLERFLRPGAAVLDRAACSEMKRGQVK